MSYSQLNISEFLGTDFRSFSRYDCHTNLPSMIDGWKVSQRKVIYNMTLKNKKMKVEQFANDTAAVTCYHHGSSGLEGVIVGLTQNFPGSNNVNWLQPVGQFGNMLNHAAAAGRYISVEPNDNFKQWFRKEDEIILEYLTEDDHPIEPKYFIPVVPTILFNGSAGIGTGYSCKILSYHPDAVVRNVKEVLAGKKQTPLVTYVRGFAGTIVKTEEGQTIYTGKIERINTTTVRITALPVGQQLDDVKDNLSKLIDSGEIRDFDDNSSVDQWSIDVYTTRAWLVDNTDDDIIRKFKLVSRDSENIVVWGPDGKIVQFETPEQLLESFVTWRLTKYEERRLKQIEIEQADLEWMNEKIRFIRFYIKNSQWFSQSTKKQILERMAEEKFMRPDELLSIRVYNLTGEAIEKLLKEIDEKNAAVEKLQKTTAKAMYAKELG